MVTKKIKELSKPVVKKKKTEYTSVALSYNQTILNVVTKGDIIDLKFHEKDMNDTWFYCGNGFCTYAEIIKFHDKLNFKKLGEVLNFLNEQFGWKIFSITPYKYDNDNYFLYTFYREIEY